MAVRVAEVMSKSVSSVSTTARFATAGSCSDQFGVPRPVCRPTTSDLLPFGWPPFPGRIFGSLPKRGDVAVFKYPRDNSTDYIKRIVGLPGDHIQMRHGELYINGQLCPRTPQGDYVADDNGIKMVDRLYQETLPNGVKHDIIKQTDEGDVNNTQDYVVPPDRVFAMGDNRDNSADSRFMNGVGFVPVENLVGKAEIIFFSVDAEEPWWEFWWWPFEIRWSRLLMFVR